MIIKHPYTIINNKKYECGDISDHILNKYVCNIEIHYRLVELENYGEYIYNVLSKNTNINIITNIRDSVYYFKNHAIRLKNSVLNDSINNLAPFTCF